MINQKHKVFISYHHANDQAYKKKLQELNVRYDLFIDGSVDTGDISEDLDDDVIRRKIRDEYLQDSTVTIVLVGTETKNRKHVDWEIYSSMYDGAVNKKSGVLVINLPTTGSTNVMVGHGDVEKLLLYPTITDWTSYNRVQCESAYPCMPDRIVDNLIIPDCKISVANWNTLIQNIEQLRFLINATFSDRTTCEYDLSRPMRKKDSLSTVASILAAYALSNRAR